METVVAMVTDGLSIHPQYAKPVCIRSTFLSYACHILNIESTDKNKTKTKKSEY